ncbi:CBS domain-containing protein [Candidatus Woesearchaeota archaeon]|nr:CBS domain-containing protein [Candidatus Woesearchaeota archaeon]
MLYDLPDIKRLRTQHGLTQAELAKRAGVSQSLIAKVEAGRLDPTFTRAKQIFSVLESLDQEREQLTKDVMVAEPLSCPPEQPLGQAIQVMNERGISQLPVVSQGRIVGLLSEGGILDALASGKRNITSALVQDVMADVPPTVSDTTRMSAVAPLLRHFPIVLVTSKGALRGVITKADMLRAMSR